ncbi:MAG: hypothetical protein V4604_02740 [Bacteroidota bacterium]
MREDILDDNQFNKESPKKKSWFKLLVIHFLLFGAGLFYADRSRIRYWIYILCAVYAWASFLNVFAKIIPDLVEFHNKGIIGAMTIFVSWGIAYIVGGIDALVTFGMRRGGR